MSDIAEAIRILSADDPHAEAAAPSLVPGGALAQPPASLASEAIDILSKPPEDLRALVAAQNRSPSVGQRAGSFATGVNDVIANTAGAPADIAANTLNLFGDIQRRLNQALPASMQPYATQPAAPITNPFGGTATINNLLSSTIGRTTPQDEFDRLLYGAGAGTGSALTGMGIGGALNTARLAPMLANTLLGGGSSLPSVFGNLATGAGSGFGSVGGADLAGAMTGNNDVSRAIGSLAGGLAGGVATAMLPALATNAYRFGGAALRPFTESGREGIAGRILNESATYGEPQIPQVPFGIQPTLGQASNDPGLLALERAVQQASPVIQGEMAARASDNNQALRNALSQVGQPAGREPYQISQQAAAGLEANRGAARGAERAAWEAIDPTNSVMVPMQPIRDRMNDYIGGLTITRRNLVPNDIVNMVMYGGPGTGSRYRVPETLQMREVQDLRSVLTGRERMARIAGDYNTANVLRNLDEALFQRLPEGAVPMPATGDQAATLRYQNALDQSRQYNETFNAKPIRDIFRVEGTPDSAVLDKMLAPGQGQAERVGQYLKATLGKPELGQQARDWFVSKLDQAVSSARQDAEGDPFVLGSKLSQFVDRNRPLIDSGMFTDAQRKVIDNLVEAATIVERTGRAGPIGGSDTAAKLLGNDYISALVGGWFKPVNKVAELAGAGVGGATHGYAGAVLGALAANRATSGIYASAARKVTDLLAEAMRDPEFAKELMRKASPANTQFASPKLQNFLATVPLTVETTGRQ